jgi:A/G-specific adenine glycosylase
VEREPLSLLLADLKKFYKKSARARLPWRRTRDPYRILVSEVMLQQTQVGRVVPYYERWMREFPTAKALSQAKLSKVLKAWQGLGYNRRAKYLHSAAKILSKKSSGRPSLGTSARLFSLEFLAALPGVGPYTAAAVQTFAYNKPNVFIETNIRTVFFYHLGHSDILEKVRISDKELLPLVEEALKKSQMQPREFYWALMDYGSHLKKQGVKLNSKSKHYTKQSKFAGSTRELRGALLRELLKGPATQAQLIKRLSPGRGRGEVEGALTRLAHEGLLKRFASTYRVA